MKKLGKKVDKLDNTILAYACLCNDLFCGCYCSGGDVAQSSAQYIATRQHSRNVQVYIG